MGDLIARLEAATEGNRELDCLIREWDDPRYTSGRRVMYYGEPTGEHVSVDTGGWSESPAFTTSIDAAVALIERKLPSANCIGVESYPDDDGATTWEAYVSRNRVNEGHWMKTGFAKTPALALCLALLRALEHPTHD